MAVKQDQTVATANMITSMLQQIKPMLATIDAINTSYTNLQMADVLNAMPTAAQNPDGSLGAPDTAGPVSGNPIDTTKVSRLSIAISAYDYGVMLTLLQQMAALFKGDVVAQQQSAPVSLAKATSGGQGV